MSKHNHKVRLMAFQCFSRLDGEAHALREIREGGARGILGIGKTALATRLMWGQLFQRDNTFSEAGKFMRVVKSL
jgi:hypothetical protein